MNIAFHRAGIDREYQRIYNTNIKGAADRRLAHEESQKVMTASIEPGRSFLFAYRYNQICKTDKYKQER